MHRRTFLRQSSGAALALGVGGLGCRGEGAGQSARRAERVNLEKSEAVLDPPVRERSHVDPMDDALAELAAYGHGGGNHAPMGAEALVALGHGDRVIDWVKRYIANERMRPRPNGRPLAPAEQTAALGKSERIGDWNATFRAAIAGDPWESVLRSWLPTLMPGLAAAATHGIIRTSHATRSLSRRDTELRRFELADALAYWAAFSQPLVPLGEPRATAENASAVLAQVPSAAQSRRKRGMTKSLDARAAEPEFIRIANSARAMPGAEGAFLSDLSATFTALYVEYGSLRPVPYVHAVTGPAALRILLPYLEADSRIAATTYAWQVAAGLWSSFAPANPATADLFKSVTGNAPDWETALNAAVENGDVHAIKLAEVCQREAQWNQDHSHVYHAATLDVAKRL